MLKTTDTPELRSAQGHAPQDRGVDRGSDDGGHDGDREDHDHGNQARRIGFLASGIELVTHDTPCVTPWRRV